MAGAEGEHEAGYTRGERCARGATEQRPLRIVNRIGFDSATLLLFQVPRLLPAQRTFGSVHTAFETAANTVFGSFTKEQVHQSFVEAGVGTGATRDATC